MKNIRVIAPDGTIEVDGVLYFCAIPTIRPGLKVLQYDYTSQVGSLEFHDRTEKILPQTADGIITPYLVAWEKGQKAFEELQQKQAEEDAAKEAEAMVLKAEADAQAQQRADEERRLAVFDEARLAQKEKDRPLVEARRFLASTDYKIIKIMEAALIDNPAMADLLAQRQTARNTINLLRPKE